MYMAKELDAGDVILQKETPIGPDEDAQALTVRLADLGAEALSEAVAAIGNGTAARLPAILSASGAGIRFGWKTTRAIYIAGMHAAKKSRRKTHKP